MLLRSLTKHVKDQNWFAVALDFVIVVVGILIAFQITNWNESKADKARVERHLEKIVFDLRADIEEVGVIIEATEYRSSAVRTVLKRSGFQFPRQFETPSGEVLDVPDFPPFESKLAESANTALSWLSTLDGSRGGYEALVSSGDLQLIEKPGLGSQIQGYYALADELYDQDRAHQELRDRVTFSKHRLGIGVGNTSLEELIELAKLDKQFAAELSSLASYDFIQIESMRAFAGQAKALIAAIEESR